MTAAVFDSELPVAKTPYEASLKTDVLIGLGVGVVLTTLSYVVGLAFGWITEINWLEVAAVFTSYSATFLSVRQRRLNYAFGIVSTILYVILFLQFGLLASMILNIYLIPTLIYGIIRWRKDADTRPVEHVKLKMIPVYLAVSALVWWGAVLLVQAFGGQLATFDAVIFAATILAQFLLDNKKLETWIVWFVVNVFAIYVYFTSGLPLVGFQYIFFLLNTGYGYYSWRKSMKVRSHEG
jgi:nicotinamide mononucleotide transporter